MFDQLTALGYGIVVFAIVIGIGVVVLYNFGGSTACSNLVDFTWNRTSNLCYQNANHTNISTPTHASYTNINYLGTQLGTTGLAGWTPAVIAIAVGLLFLGAFMIGKGGKNKGRY